MSMQESVAVRNARLDAVATAIGASAILKIFSGALPANCAAADPAGALVSMTLPATYFSAAASGSKAKTGTWSGTGSAAGTAACFRLYDSTGTTCHQQGTAGQNVVINTNALTAANGNVLNFAATTGVVVGMNVSGTGVPAGATVVAVTGTTVTLSSTSTAGVANATAITFSYDLPMDNAVVAVSQTVTVNTYTLNAGNA